MTTIRRARIVEKVGSKYRVRVPIYHGIEGSANYVVDKNLPLAPVSTFTKIVEPFVNGDIVFVIFENDDKNLPIILGLVNNEDVDRFPKDITMINKLVVSGEAQLPKSTVIGSVTDTQIQHLKNVAADVQEQINTKQTVFQYIGEYESGDIFNIEDSKEIYLILKENDYQVDTNIYNIDIGTKFKIGNIDNYMVLEKDQPVVAVGTVTSVVVYGRSS